jgi:four helix bundle protein
LFVVVEVAVQDFRNLKVWEKAHNLTLCIYKSSKRFPREEIYGLTSQMRRASVSIGANIAEGSCRNGDADFARFLQMAAGSASELDYHLLLARDLDLLETVDYEHLSGQAEEVKRMLASLMRKLRAES